MRPECVLTSTAFGDLHETITQFCDDMVASPHQSILTVMKSYGIPVRCLALVIKALSGSIMEEAIMDLQAEMITRALCDCVTRECDFANKGFADCVSVHNKIIRKILEYPRLDPEGWVSDTLLPYMFRRFMVWDTIMLYYNCFTITTPSARAPPWWTPLFFLSTFT